MFWLFPPPRKPNSVLPQFVPRVLAGHRSPVVGIFQARGSQLAPAPFTEPNSTFLSKEQKQAIKDAASKAHELMDHDADSLLYTVSKDGSIFVWRFEEQDLVVRSPPSSTATLYLSRLPGALS